MNIRRICFNKLLSCISHPRQNHPGDYIFRIPFFKRNSIQLIAPHQGSAVWFLFSTTTTNKWRVKFALSTAGFLISHSPPKTHNAQKTSWFHYRFFTTFISFLFFLFAPFLQCNIFIFSRSIFFNKRKFEDFHFVLPGIARMNSWGELSIRFAEGNSIFLFISVQSTIGGKRFFSCPCCCAYFDQWTRNEF